MILTKKYVLQVMLQEKEVFVHGTYAKTVGRNLELRAQNKPYHQK